MAMTQERTAVVCLQFLFVAGLGLADPFFHGPNLMWTEQGTDGRVQLVGIAGQPREWIRTTSPSIVGDAMPPADGIKHSSSRIAIGFRYSTQEVYWSDVGFKEIHKTRLTLNVSDPQEPAEEQKSSPAVEVVFSGTSREVNGLAVDWLSGSVYWTDALYNWIAVASGMHMDIYRQLVLTGLDKPMGLVLDPIAGHMYWCTWGAVPKIERATLAGEERTTLVDSHIDRPKGMTLDYDSKQLYWVDDFLDTIDVLDLNTMKRRPLRSGIGTRPGPSTFFGITLGKDFLFVTDQMYKTIRIFDRYTHEHIHNVLLGRVPYDIMMYEEYRQRSVQSECDVLGCEHLCVSLGKGQGKCMCSYGYSLNSDNITCKADDSLRPPMYVYSVGKALCGTPVNVADRDRVRVDRDVNCFLNVTGEVVSMAADVNGGSIFYSDGLEETVTRARIVDGVDNSYIVTVQAGYIRGMAVDWLSSNLYYTDLIFGHIFVSRLEGRYPAILCNDVGSPRGIAVNPLVGKMYWVDTTTKTIWETDMACRNKTAFVHRVVNADGLCIDLHDQRLYWTQRQGIFSIRLDGTDKRTLTDVINYNYRDVAIYQDYFALSDGYNGIFFGEKMSGEVLRGFRHLDANVSHDIITYSSYLQPLSKGPCDVRNGGCAQLCIPTPTGHVCRCALGFELAKDKRTCISDLQRGRFLLFVDPYHKQVYQMDLRPRNSTDGAPLKGRAVQGVGLSTPELPTTVDLDTKTERVFWGDERAGVIKCIPLLGGQETQILDLGQDAIISSLSVLGQSDTIVFVNKNRTSGNSAIYVSTIDGRHVTHFQNITTGRKITVDERNKMIYWADDASGNGTWVIYKKQVATSEVTALWPVHGEIRSLALSYSDDFLYWCTHDTIWKGSLGKDAEDPVFVYREPKAKMTSIAVVADYIYLSYWNKRTLFQLNVTAKVAISITATRFARITDIKEFWRLPPREKPVVNTLDDDDGNPNTGGVSDFLERGVPVPIVLGVGAGVVALILLIVVIACIITRRARRKQPLAVSVDFLSPAHDNPTYITTELVDNVYEGLPGATSLEPPEDDTVVNEKMKRQSHDSDLPDILMTEDGTPLEEVSQPASSSPPPPPPPPLPSPRDNYAEPPRSYLHHRSRDDTGNLLVLNLTKEQLEDDLPPEEGASVDKTDQENEENERSTYS